MGTGDLKTYRKQLTLECNIVSIELLSAEIEALTEQFQADPSDAMKLQLACEEIFSNIVFYAFDGQVGPPIVVDLEFNDGLATVCFTDSGKEFDPLAHEAPDVEQSLDEREIGGLGIFLVRKTMDSVHYERRGSLNVFTITKKLIH